MTLTLNEYQRRAARTRRGDQTKREAISNAALGVADEAGEVAGVAKKYLFHNHTDNAEKMLEELGDVIWYVAWLAALYGFTMEEVALNNLSKLAKRYPDGFSAERSINREEVTA